MGPQHVVFNVPSIFALIIDFRMGPVFERRDSKNNRGVSELAAVETSVFQVLTIWVFHLLSFVFIVEDFDGGAQYVDIRIILKIVNLCLNSVFHTNIVSIEPSDIVIVLIIFHDRLDTDVERFRYSQVFRVLFNNNSRDGTFRILIDVEIVGNILVRPIVIYHINMNSHVFNLLIFYAFETFMEVVFRTLINGYQKCDEYMVLTLHFYLVF